MRALLTLLVLLITACKRPPAPPNATGRVFTFPVPDGYADVTEDMHQRGLPPTSVAIEATRESKGYRPSITMTKAAVPAHISDLPTCTETAQSFAGPAGTVKNAAFIEGPVGRSCQMHVVRPEGVALVTELHRPNETWLMTCNHADGDAVSERVCRQTLAAFKFVK